MSLRCVFSEHFTLDHIRPQLWCSAVQPSSARSHLSEPRGQAFVHRCLFPSPAPSESDMPCCGENQAALPCRIMLHAFPRILCICLSVIRAHAPLVTAVEGERPASLVIESAGTIRRSGAW